MIQHTKLLIALPITLLLIASCGSGSKEINSGETPASTVAKADEEGEAYLSSIDFNDSLNLANSLYYSKTINGRVEWTEVVMHLDDSSRIIKMEERMALLGSDAVFSNHFYYKDGRKYATKQFFQESEGDSTYFVELLSYYDTKEKVKATKRRTAIYEDQLDQQQFMVAEKTDCSSERAFSIINQTGEFETTYQGFVDMDGFKFLVVGENKKDGFSSAIIVQEITPLIMELRAKQKQMLGTPLIVQFQTIREGGGTEQILLGVSKK